jgi:hypothetical protein
MSKLPKELEQILSEKIYKRKQKVEVTDTINRLGVTVSDVFVEFFETYSGSFWSQVVPYEMLDIVEDEPNIELSTVICRKEYGFPKQFLVLSELSTGAVLVLDSETDKVYEVDFEGGTDLLFQGKLKESWPSFTEFLKAYFEC